jgi:hypothetical protein
MFKGLKEKIWPSYQMNEQEQLIFDIIKMLGEQPDTELKVAPISDIYYIVNRRLAYWVAVEEFTLTITNHKFRFNHTGNSVFHMDLLNTVRQYVETQITEFQETVFQNQIELLENIKSNIESNPYKV